MLTEDRHVAEQKILLVETYRANFREFADWRKYGYLARVAHLKY